MPSLARRLPTAGSRRARPLAVIAIGLLLAAGSAAPVRAASMTVVPASGPAGTLTQVTVSGITTHSPLTLRWDGSPATPSTIRQIGGTLTVTMVVPADVVGPHRLDVVDRNGRTWAASTYTLTSPTAPAPGESPAPSAAPTPTPAPSASPAPTSTPAPADATVRWALIGNDGTHLAAERAAGLTTKVFELSWSAYEPAEGAYSSSYVDTKRREAAALRAAGFTLILSFGVQYAPSWLMAKPDARFVDQQGTPYDDTTPGSGRANYVWNDALRALQARYVARVFADLGTDWAAVRIGGGRYGELGYPAAAYGTHTNTYWAFDANAARSNPVPGWKPGMASPNGEAATFARWYLDRLAGYAAWQAQTVRASYGGRIMLLLPSFGIRPGQLDAAVTANLSGTTSAEQNGEVQRGYDYPRQVAAVAAAVPADRVVPTTTWLDCPYGSDTSSRASDWRPVHYIASIAQGYGMGVYGENTGQGSATDLTFTVAQAKAFGLIGFAWYKESEVYGGSYATIDDLARAIAGG